MDNFLDKLAHRFSAQEMINANSQAEMAEMNRLRLQVSEYEMILQEMRKLNYKNTELSEKMDALIGDNADKISAMREDEQKLIDTLRNLADEQTRNHEAQLGRLEERRSEYERQAQEKSDIEQKIMDALKNLADEQSKNREAQLERLEEERLERERQAQEKSDNEQKIITAIKNLADEQSKNREAQLERLEEERLERERQAQEKSDNEQKIITAIKNLADEQTRNREVQLERFEEERLERERQAQEKSESEQKLITAIKNLTDEQTRNREAQLERLEEERLEREKQAQEKAENDAVVITELLEEKFKQSDDHIHKENVKVYRNVQAVVADEIKRQNELNEQENNKLRSKLNAVVTVSIISILVSFGTIALCVLTLLTSMGINLF